MDMMKGAAVRGPMERAESKGLLTTATPAEKKNKSLSNRTWWSATVVIHCLLVALCCSTGQAWLQPYCRKRSVPQHVVGQAPFLLYMAYTNEEALSVGEGKAQSRKLVDSTKKETINTPNGDNEDKTPEEQQLDYTGAGTLGDIMSLEEGDELDESIMNTTANIPFLGKKARRTTVSSPTRSGLVTHDGGTLEARFGIKSPLDRMAATANGNLQRLFSSYYDAPVHVVVDKCNVRSDKTTIWDRVVHLTVHNQTFCTATSEIVVRDEACQDLVQSGQVGLGQLFRHLDKLPTFTLMDAGLSTGGGLWRHYQLSCAELQCEVHEVFVPHAWEIQPIQ